MEFFYKVNGKDYPVNIINKRIKNIHYRFRNGEFIISAPRLVSKKVIINGLDKYAEKLIKAEEKTKSKGDGYLYLLGVKIYIDESGEIKFHNAESIKYKSKADLDKKLKKFFLDLITKRVEYYSSLMKVPLYKVRVNNAKTRFGSNSKKTKTINFSTMLMAYSIEIIDSVVVHELAHILFYDHSKNFYNVVYKYCPSYDIYRKKLIKGEFK